MRHFLLNDTFFLLCMALSRCILGLCFSREAEIRLRCCTPALQACPRELTALKTLSSLDWQQPP